MVLDIEVTNKSPIVRIANGTSKFVDIHFDCWHNGSENLEIDAVVEFQVVPFPELTIRKTFRFATSQVRVAKTKTSYSRRLELSNNLPLSIDWRNASVRVKIDSFSTGNSAGFDFFPLLIT